MALMKKFGPFLLFAPVSMVVAVVVFFLFSPGFPRMEAFKPEPIPDNLVEQVIWCGAIGYIEKNKPLYLRKLYKVEDAQYGMLHFGTKRMGYAVYSSTVESGGNLLVMDFNKNMDPNDDPVFRLPVSGASETVSFRLFNKREIKARLCCPFPERNIICLAPMEWHKGRIELAGKQYNCALVDTHFNGFDLKGDDLLVVDVNGDGVFELDMVSRMMEGLTGLRRAVSLMGEVWDIKLNSRAPSVSLRSTRKPCGSLKILLPHAWEEGQAIGCLLGIKDSEEFDFTIANTGKSVKAPAGGHSVPLIMLTRLKNGRPMGKIRLKGPDKLEIKVDQVCTIKLGELKGAKITFRELEATMRIGIKLISEGNLEYLSIMKANENGVMENVPAPVVKVYDGKEEGKLLGQGTLEYG
jgi:hypothetical protein